MRRFALVLLGLLTIGWAQWHPLQTTPQRLDVGPAAESTFGGDLVWLRNDRWVSVQSDTTSTDQVYASLLAKSTTNPRRVTNPTTHLTSTATVGASTNSRLNGACRIVVQGQPAVLVVQENSSDSGRGVAVWGSFSDGTNYGAVADNAATWHNGTAWQSGAWSGLQYFHNEGTGEDVEYVDCVSLGPPGAETNRVVVAYSVEGVADDIHVKVCTITSAPTTWLACGTEYQIHDGTVVQEKEPIHLATVGTDEIVALPYRIDSTGEIRVSQIKVTSGNVISKYTQQCEDGTALCSPNLHLFESANACGNSSIPWYPFGVFNTPNCQHTTSPIQGARSLQITPDATADRVVQVFQDSDLFEDDFAAHAKFRIDTAVTTALLSHGPAIWQISDTLDFDDTFGRYGVSVLGTSPNRLRLTCGGDVFVDSSNLSTSTDYELVVAHRKDSLTTEWWLDGVKQTDCVSDEAWPTWTWDTMEFGGFDWEFAQVAADTDVDPGADTIDLPGLAFGFCYGPFEVKAAPGGTIPAGLAAITAYWTLEESAGSDTLKLYPTSSCTTPVDITADGTGFLDFSGPMGAGGSIVIDEVFVTGHGTAPSATTWSEELNEGFKPFAAALWGTTPGSQEPGWCGRSGKGIVTFLRVDQASNDDLVVRAWPWRQDYLRHPSPELKLYDNDATGSGDLKCTMPNDTDLILQHRGNWQTQGPGLVRHCKVDWDSPAITCEEPQVAVHLANFGGVNDSYVQDRPSSIVADLSDSGVIDVLSTFYDRGTNPSKEATLLRFVETPPTGERMLLAGAEHGPVDGRILYFEPELGPGPTVIPDTTLADGARSGATSNFHYLFEVDSQTQENVVCAELPPARDYTIHAEIGLIGTCAIGGGTCDAHADCTASGDFCDTTTDDERVLLGFYGANGEELCEGMLPAGSVGVLETHFSGRRKECDSVASNHGTPCTDDSECIAEEGNLTFCGDAAYAGLELDPGYGPLKQRTNRVNLTYRSIDNPFGVRCITNHDGVNANGAEVAQGECSGGDEDGNACASSATCTGGGTCIANPVSAVVDATKVCVGIRGASSQTKRVAFDTLGVVAGVDDWHFRIWDGHPNAEIAVGGTLTGCSSPNADDCVDDAIAGGSPDTGTFWQSSTGGNALRVNLEDLPALGTGESIAGGLSWFHVGTIGNTTTPRVRTQTMALDYFGRSTNLSLFEANVLHAGFGGLASSWNDGAVAEDADIDGAELGAYDHSGSTYDFSQEHLEVEITTTPNTSHATLVDLNGGGQIQINWTGDSRANGLPFATGLASSLVQTTQTAVGDCSTGGTAVHHWSVKTCGEGSLNLLCDEDADCAAESPAPGGPTPPLCLTGFQRCMEGYGGNFTGAQTDILGGTLGRPDYLYLQLDWLNTTITFDNRWRWPGTILQDVDGNGVPDGDTGKACLPSEGRTPTNGGFASWDGLNGTEAASAYFRCAFGTEAGNLSPLSVAVRTTPATPSTCADRAALQCAFGPNEGQQVLMCDPPGQHGGCTSFCAGSVDCGNVCYDDDTIVCTVSGAGGECSATASQKCIKVPAFDTSCPGQPAIVPTDGVALKVLSNGTHSWSDFSEGRCGDYAADGSDVNVWSQTCHPLPSGDGLCCADTAVAYMIEQTRSMMQEVIDRNLSTNTPAGCADPTCDNVVTVLTLMNDGYGDNDSGVTDNLFGCWGKEHRPDGGENHVWRAWAKKIRTSDWALDLIPPNCEGTADTCWGIGTTGPGNGCASGVECLRNTVPPALLDGFRHFYREGARGRPETLTIDGVHPWHTPASPLPNIPAEKTGAQVQIDQMTLGCLTKQTGDTKEYDVDGTCLNAFVTPE